MTTPCFPEPILRPIRPLGRKGIVDVGEAILDYVLREMKSPEGGFYSTQDADSEGEEGKFYVWTRDEIKEVLGKEKGNRFLRLLWGGHRRKF